jgi:tRNA (guanine-N7-)-methyltransferase
MAELIPPSYVDQLELATCFGRTAPVEVDLGCGDGGFLVDLAAQYPERDFLGIERLVGRVRSACAKAAHRKVQNVRVLRIESGYAVRYLLPPASVDTFHLNFPDPWPKKRHQRRRIVTEEFVRAIGAALRTAGSLLIATDQLDYFDAIRQLIASDGTFVERAPGARDHLPLTAFERRFHNAGVAIHRLELVKAEPRI